MPKADSSDLLPLFADKAPNMASDFFLYSPIRAVWQSGVSHGLGICLFGLSSPFPLDASSSCFSFSSGFVGSGLLGGCGSGWSVGFPVAGSTGDGPFPLSSGLSSGGVVSAFVSRWKNYWIIGPTWWMSELFEVRLS